jgi:hypothetical protein
MFFSSQLSPTDLCRCRLSAVLSASGLAKADLDDVLTGGAVLPGFKCNLRKIFLPG